MLANKKTRQFARLAQWWSTLTNWACSRLQKCLKMQFLWTWWPSIFKTSPMPTPMIQKLNFWYGDRVYKWQSSAIQKELFQKKSKFFFESKGHSRTFFEKLFCPRCLVENSTLTLKIWALKSNGVKSSFGARIALIMISSSNKMHWIYVLI